MISEKKINYYLHFAENSCNEECQKIITQLVDEVRKLLKDLDGIAHDNTALELKNEQLEKEVNWLANAVSYINAGKYFKNPYPLCTERHEPEDTKCVKCWQEAARKVVQNG